MQCGHNGAQFTPDKEIKKCCGVLVLVFFWGVGVRILKFIYLVCVHTLILCMRWGPEIVLWIQLISEN